MSKTTPKTMEQALRDACSWVQVKSPTSPPPEELAAYRAGFRAGWLAAVRASFESEAI